MSRASVTPWDDDEQANQQALNDLLGTREPSPSAPSADPVSTTMPIDPVAAPVFDPPQTSAPTGDRRGWNNLNLAAPTQRGTNTFQGFNDDRALSGGDPNSVKDALRRFLGGLDFNLQGQSKQQIDDFMEGQRGAAGQYGLDIQDIQGDRMLINTRERGPEWVDYIVDAGGSNPQFGYQADLDAVEGGGGSSAPAAAQMGAQRQAPSIDRLTGPGAAEQIGARREDPAIDRILAEVAALTQGGPSPMDRDALEALLRI
jgi:hypothetical protein